MQRTPPSPLLHSYGAVGDGTADTADKHLPVPVCTIDSKPCPGGDELVGVVEISAGGYHSCALLNDTTGRCWGFDG